MPHRTVKHFYQNTNKKNENKSCIERYTVLKHCGILGETCDFGVAFKVLNASGIVYYSNSKIPWIYETGLYLTRAMNKQRILYTSE